MVDVLFPVFLFERFISSQDSKQEKKTQQFLDKSKYL